MKYNTMTQNCIIFSTWGLSIAYWLSLNCTYTQMTTCRHDMGVTHAPWGAGVVMVCYTHGWTYW